LLEVGVGGRKDAHVDALRRRPRLAERIFVVRYEDACAEPQALVQRLLAFCGLADPAGRVAAAASTLCAPPDKDKVEEASVRAVREEAGEVAGRYGYRPPVAKAA